MDAPLLDVTVGKEVGEQNGGLRALHFNNSDGDSEDEEMVSSRRWYVEEQYVDDGNSKRLSSSNNDDNKNSNDDNKNKKSTTVKYSGLDASLLHLSQIWSRGGANNNNNNTANNGGGGIEQCLPFQGILGIQQGANVAAMLPLLRSAHGVYNDNTQEEENGEEKENNKCIFDGLQFVILVDGTDIMCQDDLQEKEVVEEEDVKQHEVNKENNDNTATKQQQAQEDDDDDWYVGPNGIESLHVIAEINQDSSSKRNSELLAKRYGPNATIQYYKPTKKKSPSSPSSNSSKIPTTQKQQSYNHNRLTSPSLHNILGKYLVQQKNNLHSNPQRRKLLQLQHQLCHVEQLASVLITEEVKKNPPKCLMAMIGPAAAEHKDGEDGKKKNGEDESDDSNSSNSKRNNSENDNDETSNTSGAVKAVVGKTVGAWQGPGRVPGEQGGGAPCPETFLLRQEERQKNDTGGSGVVASHDVILADEK